MIGLGEKRYAYWEEVNEGILRQFSPGRGLVLDVGCGSGALAEAISRRGYTVWGIERDATALAAARGRLARIIEADIADAAAVDTAIAGTRFDYLILSDVLEHLYDPFDILQRYLRHLKPGGVLLVSVPNVAVWTNRLALLFGRFRYAATGVMDRTHIRFFTFATARELVSAAGCTVTKIDYTPYVVRALLPLIKKVAGGPPAGSSEAGWRKLADSPAYRWYLAWVYPLEYAAGWLMKPLVAFRIIIKAAK